MKDDEPKNVSTTQVLIAELMRLREMLRVIEETLDAPLPSQVRLSLVRYTAHVALTQ